LNPINPADTAANFAALAWFIPALMLIFAGCMAYAWHRAHKPPPPDPRLADVIRRIQTQNRPAYLKNQKRRKG
jgi:hypothetical protein